MDKKPNERHLTVSCYREEYSDQDVPFLRLKGKWLRNGGFESGTHVKVLVLEDQMIITKDDDQARRQRIKKQQELKKLKSQLNALQKELNQQIELF